MGGYIYRKNGKALIRNWSDLNPELDFFVIVDESVADKADDIIDEAIGNWWQDDMGLGYCECFELELEDAGIEYECYSLEEYCEERGLDWEYLSQEEEDGWERYNEQRCNSL